MTLDTLSEASGVNLSTLYRIVAGAQDPKLTTAAAIADALGVTLNQLAAGHAAEHRTSA
jgi:transcriptional regulator with XRE-family HTH domain